jgi:hypothetical protein
MADSPKPPVTAPWHLWVVGGLSILWNAMGALDFTLTEMRSEAYLKALTPEQFAYITGFPIWAVIAWGVATWGSLVGSLLLLLRNALAVPVNLTVLVAMVPTFAYNYLLSDGIRIMGREKAAGMLTFTACIVVVAILLFIYARAMRRRGVLR